MIKVHKALGGNTDFITAQGFFFIQDHWPNQDKGSSLLLAIIAASGEDIFTKVRIAGLELENNFFENESSTEERLQNCLEYLIDQLKTSEEKNILLVLWQEDILHLLGIGSNEAFLERDQKLVNLTAGSADKQLISGHINPEDKLLLINSGAFKDLGDDFLIKLLATPSDELEDEVENYLNSKDKPDPVAVLIVENQIVQNLKQSDEENDLFLINDYSKEPSANFLVSVKGFFSKAKIFLGQVFLNRKIRLLALLLVILLIGYFGFSNFINRDKKQKDDSFNILIADARQKYQTAQNLKDSEPQQSKLNLDQAKQKLDQALALKPNAKDALDLKKTISENNNNILKVTQISDWPLFLSLDLIRKDFSATRLSQSLGKILLLDEAKKTLVTVDLQKKTNQILAGPNQLGEAKFASLNGENAFVYSEDKGIINIDLKNQKSVQVVKPDPDWGKITDIYAFSGNVYLLDSLKNQIWKYVPIESGYSAKSAYIKEDQKVDLAGGKRLQIDYSVWVFKTGPEILKFTGGGADHFAIGGLENSLQEITSFFVAEEEDKVHILDPKDSRILIVKKNGEYLGQISGDKFKNAADFIVDLENKKIYLLENNKIYSINTP